MGICLRGRVDESLGFIGQFEFGFNYELDDKLLLYDEICCEICEP